MSTKGPWESRVGKLLAQDDFLWAHKCPDSPFHGGQPKIDWIAAGRDGSFWMIEVKQIPESRLSFNIDSRDWISAGQIEALSSVAQSSAAVVLLAVGRQNRLYIYDWRRLQWHYEQEQGKGSPKPGLIKLQDAHIQLRFVTWKQWIGNHPLYHIGKTAPAVLSGVGRPRIPRTKSSSGNSSRKPAASPSTLKQMASTRTSRTATSPSSGKMPVPQKKESSALLLHGRGARTFFSGSSPTGGRKSSKIATPSRRSRTPSST